MIYFVLLLTSALWGLAPLAIKIALREWPPFTISFFRFLVAFLVLIFLIWGRKQLSIYKKDLFQLLFFSVFACLNILLFAYGIQFTTTITGALLYTFSPILVGLGSFLFLKEKFSRLQITGTGLAFLGVTLIIFSPVLHGEKEWQTGSLYGNAIILLAVLSFAIYSLGSRLLSKKFNAVTISFSSAVVSLLIFLPLSFLEFKKQQIGFFLPSYEIILAIIYLGLGATLGTFLLYQWLIKKTNAFIAGLMSYPQPIFTGLAGYFFLQERITPVFFVGMLLVFVGVFLATTLKMIFKQKRR